MALQWSELAFSTGEENDEPSSVYAERLEEFIDIFVNFYWIFYSENEDAAIKYVNGERKKRGAGYFKPLGPAKKKREQNGASARGRLRGKAGGSDAAADVIQRSSTAVAAQSTHLQAHSWNEDVSTATTSIIAPPAPPSAASSIGQDEGGKDAAVLANNDDVMAVSGAKTSCEGTVAGTQPVDVREVRLATLYQRGWFH